MRRAITYYHGPAVAMMVTLLPSEKLKPDRRRVLYAVAAVDVLAETALVLATRVPLREARRAIADHWGITTAQLENPTP